MTITVLQRFTEAQPKPMPEMGRMSTNISCASIAIYGFNGPVSAANLATFKKNVNASDQYAFVICILTEVQYHWHEEVMKAGFRVVGRARTGTYSRRDMRFYIKVNKHDEKGKLIPTAAERPQ